MTLFLSQWQEFSTALRHLAAFSRLPYPHLATELGFYLLTAFFTFSLYRFSKLHISYTHSVIYFSYVNTSFFTSIPRPSCAPHLSPTLILTQTLSCQLCHLFSFLLLFLYLSYLILGHTTACFSLVKVPVNRHLNISYSIPFQFSAPLEVNKTHIHTLSLVWYHFTSWR